MRSSRLPQQGWRYFRRAGGHGRREGGAPILGYMPLRQLVPAHFPSVLRYEVLVEKPARGLELRFRSLKKTRGLVLQRGLIRRRDQTRSGGKHGLQSGPGIAEERNATGPAFEDPEGPSTSNSNLSSSKSSSSKSSSSKGSSSKSSSKGSAGADLNIFRDVFKPSNLHKNLK